MTSRRPSPSMMVALLALFVALGGTSYAVIKLPAKSVGTRELKANAVTSAKIRARSVGRSDLSPSARIGARGARGPAGPAGTAGAPGDAVAPEAWKALPLAGWHDYGQAFITSAYRKDQRGRVYLRGLVAKNTAGPVVGDLIAVLPAGYRPPARLIFPVAGGANAVGNGYGRVDVLPTGDVVWQSGVTGEDDFTSLETISFWAD